jgi:hypothetical protein
MSYLIKPKNPLAMKGKSRPPFLISAYRLKTFEEILNSQKNVEVQSPYLKSLLSGKTRTSSRVGVFPMINPYKEKQASQPENNQDN